MCTHMHSDGVLWTLGLFSDFFPVSVIFSSKATHTVNCCFLFVLFLTVHFFSQSSLAVDSFFVVACKNVFCSPFLLLFSSKVQFTKHK